MNALKLQNLKLQSLELSAKSYVGFQHGCLIVRNGRVVAKSCNDARGHAECNAISALQRGLCGSSERKDV